MNRRKVEWAKQKLRDSAESVSVIAFKPGYLADGVEKMQAMCRDEVAELR